MVIDSVPPCPTAPLARGFCLRLTLLWVFGYTDNAQCPRAQGADLQTRMRYETLSQSEGMAVHVFFKSP